MLSKIVDNLLRPSLKRAFGIFRIKRHTIGQRRFDLVRQLSLGEIDNSRQHVIKLEVSVIALDTLVDERPNLLRAICRRCTEFAKEPHSRKPDRPAFFVEQRSFCLGIPNASELRVG